MMFYRVPTVFLLAILCALTAPALTALTMCTNFCKIQIIINFKINVRTFNMSDICTDFVVPSCQFQETHQKVHLYT